MVGTADSVLIREVSLIQSVLYREFALYLEDLDHEAENDTKCSSAEWRVLSGLNLADTDWSGFTQPF